MTEKASVNQQIILTQWQMKGIFLQTAKNKIGYLVKDETLGT